MNRTPEEIREWTRPALPCRSPAPEACMEEACLQAARVRLEGARLLAAQLGRQLPALRFLLEHRIEEIEAVVSEWGTENVAEEVHR